MDGILKQSCVLPTGDPMPALGLGTWQLVGSACTRIVRKAIDENGIEARLLDAVYTWATEMLATNAERRAL